MAIQQQDCAPQLKTRKDEIACSFYDPSIAFSGLFEKMEFFVSARVEWFWERRARARARSKRVNGIKLLQRALEDNEPAGGERT